MEGIPPPKAAKINDSSADDKESKETAPLSSFEKLNAALSTLSPLVREIDTAYAKYEPAAGIRASLNNVSNRILNAIGDLAQARTKNPTLARRFGVPEVGPGRRVESQEGVTGSQFDRLIAFRNTLSPLVAELETKHAKYEPAGGVIASLKNAVHILNDVIVTINEARTKNPTLATRFDTPPLEKKQ